MTKQQVLLSFLFPFSQTFRHLLAFQLLRIVLYWVYYVLYDDSLSHWSTGIIVTNLDWAITVSVSGLHVVYMYELTASHNPMEQMLLGPASYKWENWGTERLSLLPKLTLSWYGLEPGQNPRIQGSKSSHSFQLPEVCWGKLVGGGSLQLPGLGEGAGSGVHGALAKETQLMQSTSPWEMLGDTNEPVRNKPASCVWNQLQFTDK